MPTSLESLRKHRAAHAEDLPSRRVWFFHSHAYFDHTVASRVEEARAFHDLIETTFAGTDHVEVHSFVERPIGPHPIGNFEVLFTREAFTDYVTWLAFNRPQSMSILVHPLTRSQVEDHVLHSLWLGPPLALGVELLERVDAQTTAAGRAEEDIINGTKKH